MTFCAIFCYVEVNFSRNEFGKQYQSSFGTLITNRARGDHSASLAATMSSTHLQYSDRFARRAGDDITECFVRRAVHDRNKPLIRRAPKVPCRQCPCECASKFRVTNTTQFATSPVPCRFRGSGEPRRTSFSLNQTWRHAPQANHVFLADPCRSSHAWKKDISKVRHVTRASKLSRTGVSASTSVGVRKRTIRSRPARSCAMRTRDATTANAARGRVGWVRGRTVAALCGYDTHAGQAPRRSLCDDHMWAVHLACKLYRLQLPLPSITTIYGLVHPSSKWKFELDE